MSSSRQRYLLVTFFADSDLSAKAVEQNAHRSFENLLGRLGAAEAHVRMVGFDETRSRAVFRCRSAFTEKLRAALALMTQIDGNPVSAVVFRSSGTIKGLGAHVQRYRQSK
jgi:ribonuclease P/MRP protein subunit POP5